MQTDDQPAKGDDQPINVGQVERWVSGFAGAALVSLSLARRSLLMALTGSALLSRAITGHSVLYARLGIDTTRRPPQPRASHEERDTVDEASWESFPASDPPAYTDTGVGGPH